MDHPYTRQPDKAKWSRAVSKNWSVDSLFAGNSRLINRDDRVASLGSCFAANMVPYLKENGLSYIEEEGRAKDFANAPPENFSYGLFSAAWGNIYTTRQFLQIIDRAFGRFKPKEDRWHVNGDVVDPFRPGLRFPAQSDREFDVLTAHHLERVRAVFEQATVIVFTLGLTEAWYSKVDGAVFPACPGTVAGEFDPEKHAFKNFRVSEIVSDLVEIHGRLQAIRPGMKLILTVSPVPLVATATDDHVLVATTYSKSVLRAACGEVMELLDNVAYFPSYEIITASPERDKFFMPDRRNVTKEAVDLVMAAFLKNCETAVPGQQDVQADAVEEDSVVLSRLVADIECEEAAADFAR